jgi:hypothetical protein
MFRLTEKRFADFFRQQPETGMDYYFATAYLKDGRIFRQVIISGGYVTTVRGFADVPFTEPEIDRFVVTHDKWDWSQDR